VRWPKQLRWRDFSLRKRLLWAFASVCLLSTSLFSLYALAFAYSVEDQFFEAMLEEEGQRQLAAFSQTRTWLSSSDSALRIYLEPSDLPEDLRVAFAAEPSRREFSGAQGRHYHLKKLITPERSSVWLVAEVSKKLVFRRMRGTVFEILLYSTLGLLMLALALAWWQAHITATPLSRLAARVARIQPTELPERLSDDASLNEVGILTRSINGLIERMRAFIEREKSFTRDASHELRTPLTVISSAAEQIAAAQHLYPADQQQLALILSATKQLQHTINSLLTLAREQHLASVLTNPYRLLPLLEQIVLAQIMPFEPYSEKAIKLDCTVGHQVCTTIPEAVLHILLSNLLGNAFAHGLSNTTVYIAAQNQRLYIRNDQAQGQQPEAPIEAFSKHPNSAGFGLGLSIVQRLSDRFGLDLQFKQTPNIAELSFALLPKPSA